MFNSMKSFLLLINGFEAPDLSGYTDRWLWVGQTHENRVLSIIYSEED
jgi:hypothetical protein